MFKNLFVYRLAAGWVAEAAAIETKLQACAFVPCGPTQASSVGWVPPRGIEQGSLIEKIGGSLLLKLSFEQRKVDPAALKSRVQEMADVYEGETGRKSGKKTLADFKEQATLELLPRCFPKHSCALVWIAPNLQLLMVDAASPARRDEVVSLLTKSLDGFALHLIQCSEAPATCMASWLMDGEAPQGFTIDRELELKSEDEMRSVIRYARHALDTDEIRQHLVSGKRPTKLALTFQDRVSFVLTDVLQIKKVEFLDLVFEGANPSGIDEQFDCDAAIATGELSKLIPDLIGALGGEHQFFSAAAEAVA